MSPKFSERIGARSVPVQVGGLDGDLRASLWNLIQLTFPIHYEACYQVVTDITMNVVKEPVDLVSTTGARIWLLDRYNKLVWHRVYDMLEHVAANAPQYTKNRISIEEFKRRANVVLEEEGSGYRFVGGQLTEISSPIEMEEVTQALERTRQGRLAAVHSHISAAIQLLGKRPVPDHRNAIKEAISAVESATKLIGTQRKGTLDDALDALADRLTIHKAMKDGFSKLYGFTSDGSGIRHALMDAPTVDAADARFMIVACSAFVNWLIVKADQAGLLNTQSP